MFSSFFLLDVNPCDLFQTTKADAVQKASANMQPNMATKVERFTIQPSTAVLPSVTIPQNVSSIVSLTQLPANTPALLTFSISPFYPQPLSISLSLFRQIFASVLKRKISPKCKLFFEWLGGRIQLCRNEHVVRFTPAFVVDLVFGWTCACLFVYVCVLIDGVEGGRKGVGN